MRAEEIRELTEHDMHSRIKELEEERFRLRFRNATQPLEDPLKLRSIRKDIARLQTVLRERTRAATGGATARSPKTNG
jgi:large subunit ribosomal protein L29